MGSEGGFETIPLYGNWIGHASSSSGIVRE